MSRPLSLADVARAIGRNIEVTEVDDAKSVQVRFMPPSLISYSDFPEALSVRSLAPLLDNTPRFTLSRAPNVCITCKASAESKLQVCSRCRLSKYCSAACQKKNWPIHKLTCIKRPAGAVVRTALADKIFTSWAQCAFIAAEHEPMLPIYAAHAEHNDLRKQMLLIEINCSIAGDEPEQWVIHLNAVTKDRLPPHLVPMREYLEYQRNLATEETFPSLFTLICLRICTRANVYCHHLYTFFISKK